MEDGEDIAFPRLTCIWPSLPNTAAACLMPRRSLGLQRTLPRFARQWRPDFSPATTRTITCLSSTRPSSLSQCWLTHSRARRAACCERGDRVVRHGARRASCGRQAILPPGCPACRPAPVCRRAAGLLPGLKVRGLTPDGVPLAPLTPCGVPSGQAPPSGSGQPLHVRCAHRRKAA